MESTILKEMGAINKGAQVPAARLRAGGRSEHCAKQKAFGTVLASAPSPEFFGAPKNPPAPWGGFLRRPGKSGEEGWGGGVFFGLCFRGRTLPGNGGL
jgi:hypothetical protein